VLRGECHGLGEVESGKTLCSYTEQLDAEVRMQAAYVGSHMVRCLQACHGCRRVGSHMVQVS
jgi:hypothetical protein